ncbi:alpha/beta fold hydrolase [Anaerobacillus alkaliphilus]|uniref:alpha/beta fold hydrolase n=1 Tax=Anaerobacillus alkaliphilus TaxID=1548597 RepID=UPI001F4FC47F|nr:alpha/beta hydrolase [Anaerobacillus alkaliphilus]
MGKVRQDFVQVKGRRIFINIVGEGEVIIFLHGGPGSNHKFFLPHVLPLSENFKLVLYDQSGCGKSDHLVNNDYSMEDEVETLEMLRQKLKLDKLNLFGESWGTILALLYATTHPDKVNKLFLTAAIGISSNGYKQFPKELLKRMTILDKIKLFIVDKKMKKGKASMKEMLKVIDPYYVYSCDNLQKKDQTPINSVVNNRIGTDISNNYDLIPKVHALSNIPIIVAQGSDDIIKPTKIKELLLDYIPHARLVEIENSGHWTVVEKSSELNRIATEFFQ